MLNSAVHALFMGSLTHFAHSLLGCVFVLTRNTPLEEQTEEQIKRLKIKHEKKTETDVIKNKDLEEPNRKGRREVCFQRS